MPYQIRCGAIGALDRLDRNSVSRLADWTRARIIAGSGLRSRGLTYPAWRSSFAAFFPGACRSEAFFIGFHILLPKFPRSVVQHAFARYWPRQSRRFTCATHSSESPAPLEASPEPHCLGGGPRRAWRCVRDWRLSAAAEAEEAGAVPAGSGDLAGDGGEARINLIPPAEALRHDHNFMQLALMVPDDDRADLDMPGRRTASA
jgi:hypothetical protein